MIAKAKAAVLPTSKTSLYAWLICAAGALFYCYEYYLRIAPSVMEPQLMKFYHVDAAGFGNLAAFYYYAYTPMQFCVGMLFDRFGVRNLIAAACAFCAVGTYFFSASHSLALADIGRFMIGFGSAFAFVGALKLASIWLPPQRFGMIAGFITSLGVLGAILGDLSLTEVVRYEGWRTSTYLMAGFGIVLAVLLFSVVREKRRNKKAGERAQHNPDSTDEEAVTFSELFYSLLQTMRKPQIWINGVIGCCLFLSLTAFAELWAVPYFKVAYHLTPEAAATMSSMVFLGWVFGGPAMGILSDWLQQRRSVLLLSAVAALLFIIPVLYFPQMGEVWLAVCLFCFGFSCGAQVLTFAVARELSSRRIAGTAVAFNNMVVMLGGVLCQPLIGWLLGFFWTGSTLHGVPQYSYHSYALALSLLPVGLIVSFLLTLRLKETRAQVKNY